MIDLVLHTALCLGASFALIVCADSAIRFADAWRTFHREIEP